MQNLALHTNINEYSTKEEWQDLIGEFYNNKEITHTNRKYTDAILKLRRNKLPGLSLISLESFAPFDIPCFRQNKETLFAMHFMLCGSMHYSVRQHSSKFENGQNNILIIPEKSLSSLFFNRNTFYSYRSIIFQDDYLEQLMMRYPEALESLFQKYTKGETYCFEHPNLINTREMNTILSQIDHASDLGNMAPLYAEGKILELLCLQIKATDCTQNTPQIRLKAVDIKKIKEVSYLLTKNISSPLTIQRLSRMVGLNEKKLKYGFKQVFHQTIFQFHFNHRMALALKLLCDSDLTILEIGIKCGYEYPSHFSTAFKNKYGVSPLQFRSKQ
ncbi:helix-turn-helix domain-containing protein [Ancylomarina longa]|uniref:AraC family transcriptional regulator n=1 Tax=Ancylomarina longa TaxID=2487017 RepID=A0A434AZ06_9BACT|nr:AraC family transcriptional regulator [Ancylomarina longa]RUT79852.1 AraC family transcriptional regulator [Ancylomarina longa]